MKNKYAYIVTIYMADGQSYITHLHKGGDIDFYISRIKQKGILIQDKQEIGTTGILLSPYQIHHIEIKHDTETK